MLAMVAFAALWMAALYAANRFNGLPVPDPAQVIAICLVLTLPSTIALITLARLFRPSASALLFPSPRVDSSLQDLARRYLEQRRTGR